MFILTIVYFISLPALTSRMVRGDTTMDEKTPQPLISSRVVRTKYGDIRGFIVTPESRFLEPVEVFRGVPYASPPIGSLRFMPPVSGAQWSGVKIAEEFSPVCPQVLPDIRNETAVLRRISKGRLEYLKRILPFLTNQSEDCLYLNIYAPAQGVRDAVARYPVLVFVHGESYEWSSGNPYDGTVLASHAGLVVVTINYRLGILGFLNPRTDEYPRSPANYGLMDQIAALHWIKENVAVFGGDPTNVTLMGHGTGAACVHFLLTSLAVPEGLLFHRAILMSGSGLSPWSLVADPNKYAAIVATHANCSPELTPPALLRCLRERPLESLLSAPVQAPDFAYAFGPSVDGVVIDTGDMLVNQDNGYEWGGQALARPATGKNQNAINIINAVLMRKSAVAQLTKYDLMLGVTKAEAYFAFSGDDVQYGIEADRRSKILKSFVRNTYSYHLSEILATIINEYTDWERPVQHPINIRDETLEALSDAQVVAPIVLTADTHSALRRNSYVYVFDYQTKYGDYPQRQGCIHGEELPYIFGAPLVGGLAHFPRNYTKAEVALSESVMLYWGNFAKTGNPNEAQESDPIRAGRQERVRMKNIEWTAYEAVHKKYLNIDIKSKLKNHYRAHRLSFWLNLVPDLHRPGGEDVPPSHHQLENEEVSPPQPTLKTFSPPIKKTTDLVLTDTALATKVPVLGVLNITSPLNFNIVGINTATQSTVGGSDIHKSDATTATPPEDGFAAYSTALSVTIAIGCSLLILNVLIFAGVYYQRDKTRMNGPDGPNGSHLKKRAENGQMPNNICGDLEGALTYQTSLKNDPATILSHHHTHSHHQLPPPEFADLPSNNVASMATLPRAPPPPKLGKSNINTLASGQLQENQPLLSTHQMQMMNTSTLTKKNTQLNAKSNVTMEELRV
ncbi:neuroligin-4, Y-linked isoform X2 [Pectinophora gossypiella]|uniref:neuroligin-4, Y-linked isoform X2 n=1 Tax=Pectinophora gossypiella TaxID=13191 RepID=UPI00214EED2B|nr:neuroligin-4, Y-linked isoform X2 [Pectinophora gossypiella]